MKPELKDSSWTLPGRGTSRSLSRALWPTFPIVWDVEPHRLFPCLVRAFEEDLPPLSVQVMPAHPLGEPGHIGTASHGRCSFQGSETPVFGYHVMSEPDLTQTAQLNGNVEPGSSASLSSQQHRLTLTFRAAESITPRLNLQLREVQPFLFNWHVIYDPQQRLSIPGSFSKDELTI